MILIDKLSYSSKLRFTNPTFKAFFSVLTLLICVMSRSIILALFTLLTMGCAAIFFGGTSPLYYIKLLRIPLLFLFIGTIAIIINYTDVLDNTLVAIPFMSKYLIISKTSVLFAGQLILTALGCVSCLFFLALTTPMTDLLMVLKKIHIPFILIELMMLIYRFIFILMDLTSFLSISQKSRLGNKNFKTSCNSAGQLMAILLVRAFQKSSYLYDSMESRCYDGKICVLEESYQTNRTLIIAAVILEITMIALSILLRIYDINI